MGPGWQEYGMAHSVWALGGSVLLCNVCHEAQDQHGMTFHGGEERNCHGVK